MSCYCFKNGKWNGKVYVAADKNESYDHVLLWNIHLRVFSGGLLRSHANKAVSDRQTKFVNKPLTTDLTIYLQ